MFPIFLFLVVFSFYCWLASESQLMSSQQRTEFATTKTAPPVQPTVALRVLLESKSQALDVGVASSPVAVARETVVVPETKVQAATKMRSLEQIVESYTIIAPDKRLALDDIAVLKIRSARKVASALGIRQKANGADKSLNCLQQEIRQQLESKPELVIRALKLAPGRLTHR